MLKNTLFAALSLGIFTTSAIPTKIRTPSAIYVGSRLSLENFKPVRPASSVDEFLGIRYGLAPTGTRRFRRSQPSWLENGLEPVKEVHVKSWAPNCMQQPGFIEMNLQTSERSEDCLFLNIWSPVASKGSPGFLDLKPVFVWFHGGSFISDSAARKLYFGAHLAASADAVIVTVNYRIDAFGFMYSGPEKLNGTETAEGNAALWDQLLALEWIQEHIEYFGGDPKRVTIGGTNSGATSVGLHLLSERSRKFFNRAVLLSGSVFTQLVNGVKSQGSKVADMWAQAAKKINCGDGNHWTIETLKCLQLASTDDLLKLLDPLGTVSLSPEIILGDQLLPFDDLLSGFQSIGKSSQKEIQVLLGSTDDEGSLVLPLLNMNTFSFVEPKKLSNSEAFEELKKLSDRLVAPKGTAKSSIDGDEVARYYINQMASGTSNNNYPKVIGSALGDFYVSCPLVEFGQRIAGLGRSKVFQYVWSRKVTSKDVPCADWMGACPGSDLVMLFGAPFEEKDQFSPEDRKLSVRFMKTIGKFLSEGKPLKQEGKEWPSYVSNSESFYYEFTGSTVSKRIYHKNWKYDLCSDLWRKYLIPKV